MARDINESDLQFIADLVAEHPDGISRAELQVIFEHRRGVRVNSRTLQREVYSKVVDGTS